MKVYSSPLPFEVDYSNYNSKRIDDAVEAHKSNLKKHLRDLGYTGKKTGEIVSFSVADGAAQYMLAEKSSGGSFVLIHLPYYDGYQYRDVQFLPKAEILRRLAQNKAISKMFS